MPKQLNIVAPINSTGYGVVGFNATKSLSEHADIALLPPSEMERPHADHPAIQKAVKQAEQFFYDADCLRIYHQNDMKGHIGKGRKLGYTFFELAGLRQNEVYELNYLDVLFVSSNWAREVCRDSGVTTQIEVVSPGVDLSVFNKDVEPIECLDIDSNPTIFFNCGKWEIRKGHDVLVEVFNSAFTKDDNVILLLNTWNPFFTDSENKKWMDHYKDSPLGDKIHIIGHRLESQNEVAGLMALADCGVFPSRAEGWGLESAEMLAMGKQVILTDYSAHQEYIDKTECLKVEIEELEYAEDGKWFFGNIPPLGFENCRWASLDKPQKEQLVSHMRSVHSEKQQNGKLKLNEAGIDYFTNKITWDGFARKIMEHVK